MYILGIDCYGHDSAAALLKDGEIVAIAEEERFTREKHTTAFPINAMKFLEHLFSCFYWDANSLI